MAFVGMGSIGKRHFKNVCNYLDMRCCSYYIDIYRSGQGEPLNESIKKKVRREIMMSSNMKIPEQYDVVFITNPTSMHYKSIQLFVNSAHAMFIEKPVFESLDVDIDALKLSAYGIYYVACPLRYHPVIQYIRENNLCGKAYAVRAISSSYLPEWRPGTDYRMCYSARQDMGGGVDIDLIHEWDYLTYLLGKIESGYAIRRKISELEIDSNDIAVYIAQTNHAIVELHLDYFGRKGIRQMEIFLPDDTVKCDILNGSIHFQSSGKSIQLSVNRNLYQMAEISHFFDIFDKKCPNDNTISNALQVLRYAQGKF